MARRSFPHEALRVLPDEHRMHLENRPRSEIREWLSARIGELADKDKDDHELLSVITLYNMTLTINLLPNELFVKIIALTRRRDTARSRWKNRLMRVCKYWRDIIAGTPPIWSVINLRDSPRFIQLSLTRTKNSLIRLEYNSGRWWRRSIEDAVNLLLRGSHTLQVSGIDISVNVSVNPHVLATLMPLLTSSLPNIVSFRLALYPEYEYHNSPLLKLQSERLPRLRSAKLNGVILDTGCSVLQNLTVLDLSNIRGVDHGIVRKSPIRLDALLDLLDQCTRLERFVYKPCKTVRAEAVKADRVTELPHMLDFHLSGDALDVASIMAHVALPSCCGISLVCHHLGTVADEPHDSAFGIPVLGAVLPRKTTHLPLKHIRGVIVKIEDSGAVTVHAPPLRRDVSLNLRISYLVPRDQCNILLPHLLRELGHFFPPALQTLTIGGTDETVRPTPEDWSGLFTAFPHLQSLEIFKVDVVDFGPAFQPSWCAIPCQYLKTLILAFAPETMDAALGMLRKILVALQKRDEVGSRLRCINIMRTHEEEPSELLMAGMIEFAEEFDVLRRDLEAVVDSVRFI